MSWGSISNQPWQMDTWELFSRFHLSNSRVPTAPLAKEYTKSDSILYYQVVSTFFQYSAYLAATENKSVELYLFTVETSKSHNFQHIIFK